MSLISSNKCSLSELLKKTKIFLLLAVFTVNSFNTFAQTTSLISDCGDFISGPSAWPYVLVATTIANGPASQASQTFTMNVTSLPADGANFRVYKTTANGSDYFGDPIALTLGSNSITVSAVGFDRAVKFQFSSGDVEFDALSLNGEDSDCVFTSETQGSEISEQTIELPAGWSMFSTYMMTDNMALDVILNPIVLNVIIAKDNFGAAYLPEFNFNGVGNITPGLGYQIKTVEATDLILSGTYLLPENNPVNLDAGWNMVGYLRLDAAPADLVLAELNDADNLIIAKNYLGAAFLPEFNFNGIGNLEPGQGYQVKINESGVLNFLSNDNSYKFSKIEVTNNILSHFQSAINTGSNMTISVPSYAWGESPSIGDEISAYNSTGELVGSAVYTEPVSVISVWGDDLTTEKIDGMENGEIISFKLWNKELNSTKELIVKEWIKGSNTYLTDAICQIGAIETVAYSSSLNQLAIYPIPAKHELNIDIELSKSEEVTVSIFNLIGELISTESYELFKGINTIRLNTDFLNDGFYLCSTTYSKNQLTRKFNVLK